MTHPSFRSIIRHNGANDHRHLLPRPDELRITSAEIADLPSEGEMTLHTFAGGTFKKLARQSSS